MKVINLLYSTPKEIQLELLKNHSTLDINHILEINLCRENLFEDMNETEIIYRNIEKEILDFFKIAIQQTHDLNPTVFLLPLIENSFYEKKMNGIVAHTDGYSNIYIYLNIKKRVPSNYIKSICIHEYQHILRNFIKKNIQKKIY